MNSKIRIFKIRTDSVQSLKDWGVSLTGTLLTQAVHSLTEENCIFEEAHIFHLNQDVYAVGIMISEPGKELIKGPDSEINLQHRKILDTAILERVPTEELYKIFTA